VIIVPLGTKYPKENLMYKSTLVADALGGIVLISNIALVAAANVGFTAIESPGLLNRSICLSAVPSL